jgi:hypothetical protein
MFELSFCRRSQRMLDCESPYALEGGGTLPEGQILLQQNFTSSSQKNRKEIERSSFQKF